jgi:hypothetical protein
VMGMDLYGWRPATVNGDYFRNTGSWWHPLAEYCKQIQPEIAAHCTHWHTNDGDGLDEKDSIALAEALQREIDSGRCEAHAKNVEAAATSEICFFAKAPRSVSLFRKWVQATLRRASSAGAVTERVGYFPITSQLGTCRSLSPSCEAVVVFRFGENGSMTTTSLTLA